MTLVLAALFGYLLGSIPFGLVLTRLAGTQDIRTIGSGNIGATNVLRTGRKGLAAGTLALDGLKATVAILIAKTWGFDAAMAAGAGAFLGHLFPVWLGFKGGKGVATYLGCLLGLFWPAAFVFAALWLAVAFLSKYSSLAALVAVVATPVAIWLFGQPAVAALMLALGLLSWWMHRDNIRRLLAGTEGRIGQKRMSGPGLRLDDASRADWLRLIRSDNVGPRTFRTLLNRFGSARAALEALPGLTRNGGKPVRIADAGDVERELEAARRIGVRFIALGEPDYPALLREIADAPPLLAIRGAASALRRESAAIVGSRNASALGLAMTQRLAQGLGRAGYVVVSGLARGVDAAAHRACLASGTVAVLAGGHRNIYPAEHEALAEQIVEAGGAVVSEMPLGWEARGRDFPRRNRIVSGLSLGVVVVEAARRSGSLITARFATEQGREVFAVPGHPLDPRAEGPNDLIAAGATMCRDADEVVAALDAMKGEPRRDLFEEDARAPQTEALWDEMDGLDSGLPVASLDYEFDEPEPTPFAAPDPVPDPARAQQAILALLGPSPVSLDDLLRLAAVPAAAARAALVELELNGAVIRHDGGLVSRAPG